MGCGGKSTLSDGSSPAAPPGHQCPGGGGCFRKTGTHHPHSLTRRNRRLLRRGGSGRMGGRVFRPGWGWLFLTTGRWPPGPEFPSPRPGRLPIPPRAQTCPYDLPKTPRDERCGFYVVPHRPRADFPDALSLLEIDPQALAAEPAAQLGLDRDAVARRHGERTGERPHVPAPMGGRGQGRVGEARRFVEVGAEIDHHAGERANGLDRQVGVEGEERRFEVADPDLRDRTARARRSGSAA